MFDLNKHCYLAVYYFGSLT